MCVPSFLASFVTETRDKAECRERAMNRFRGINILPKFIAVHNHFNQVRRLISRKTYREQNSATLDDW